MVFCSCFVSLLVLLDFNLLYRKKFIISDGSLGTHFDQSLNIRISFDSFNIYFDTDCKKKPDKVFLKIQTNKQIFYKIFKKRRVFNNNKKQHLYMLKALSDMENLSDIVTCVTHIFSMMP